MDAVVYVVRGLQPHPLLLRHGDGVVRRERADGGHAHPGLHLHAGGRGPRTVARLPGRTEGQQTRAYLPHRVRSGRR